MDKGEQGAGDKVNMKICICAPKSLVLDKNLGEHVSSVLNRAEISYEILKEKSKTEMSVRLHGVSDSEARFIVRLLQRSGYDMEISEK